MSVFAVDKFLHQMRDYARLARFRDDPRAVLADYDLTPAEAAALEAGDLAALHRLGANGYLLLGFGHQMGGGDFRAVIASLGEAPAAARGTGA
ncbi:MAG TPA: hypothetical protein VK066_17150 [Chloroflexota bacterium]|nr:hypothetical protein [Chloroflexota bacterium]